MGEGGVSSSALCVDSMCKIQQQDIAHSTREGEPVLHGRMVSGGRGLPGSVQSGVGVLMKYEAMMPGQDDRHGHRYHMMLVVYC